MKQLRMSFLLMPLFCLVIFMGVSFAPSISGALEEGRGKIRTAPEVLPSEIRGTVRINGWTGAVANAFIHAMPVSFGSSTGMQTAPKRPGVEHINPLRRTADPHVFSFSVLGLLPHTPYKLGITFPPNPVRPRERIKTFWSGLLGGVATSGAPPVAIEGYVANTEVEVKDSLIIFGGIVIGSNIGNHPIFDLDGLFAYELSGESIEICPIHDGSVRRKIA